MVKASIEWLKHARHYAFGRQEGRPRKRRRRQRRGRLGGCGGMEMGRRVERAGEGKEGKEHRRTQSWVWSPISPRRTPPGTLKGLHLDQLAHVASTVIPPDPDDQSVWRAAWHSIEKLQALLLPLWVKNPRLQHGRLLRCPEAGVQVHEVAGAYGQRTPKSHLCPSTPPASLSPGKVTTVSPALIQATKAGAL